MAWIKINKYKFVNTDSIKEVTRQQNEDGSYYIKFLIAGDVFYTTKCFEQLEKCEEIFDKLWLAMSSNKSIDISEIE
jgi:hypothetical protein